MSGAECGACGRKIETGNAPVIRDANVAGEPSRGCMQDSGLSVWIVPMKFLVTSRGAMP
jgi:hypothetical protein